MARFTKETAAEAGRRSVAKLQPSEVIQRASERGMSTLRRYGTEYYAAIRLKRTEKSTRIVKGCNCLKCQKLRHEEETIKKDRG